MAKDDKDKGHYESNKEEEDEHSEYDPEEESSLQSANTSNEDGSLTSAGTNSREALASAWSNLPPEKQALIRKRKRHLTRKFDDDMSDLEPDEGDVDTELRKTEKGEKTVAVLGES